MDLTAGESHDGNDRTVDEAADERRVDDHHHDTHARPPLFIQEVYGHYNRIKNADLDADPKVVDFRRGLSAEQDQLLRRVSRVPAETVARACSAFYVAAGQSDDGETPDEPAQDVPVLEHVDFPGLHLIPNLLPPRAQRLFVSRVLHNHLAHPAHATNLAADYDVEYPSAEELTFFATHPASVRARPKASSTKVDGTDKTRRPGPPLNSTQFLAKRLRWLTLGEQYHWPTRSYRRSGDSGFPPELAALVTGLFADLKAESGVCLLYGHKDYMPVHRDVSELCRRRLASFSFGCDGVFVVARGGDDVREDQHEGNEAEEKAGKEETIEDGQAGSTVVIRVRSGDCVVMDGESRWAWHAMPKTVSGTCPPWLADWPAAYKSDAALEAWRGYMGRKRLNVSVRQVWDK